MLAWEEFQQAFKAQLREEYDRGEKSLLRRLANYCSCGKLNKLVIPYEWI